VTSSRLNRAQHLTPAHWRILFFAWGSYLSGFASLMLLSFLLSPVKLAFGPSENQLAWLTGTAIGMSGAGGFLFGWMADAWGRRWAIAAAIVTFCAGNLLSALAPGFALFVVARAIAGLGIGGSWGSGQALIGETFPAHLRARYAAYAQSGAPLGLGLATLLGSFAEPAIGWRWIFALGVLPIALLFWLPVVPESDVWSVRGRRRLATIARGLAQRGALGIFARCLVLVALNMANYYFMITWLPRYLQVERGLTLAQSGWATLAFVAGALAGYPAFAAAAERFGRRLAFTLFSAVVAGSLLMFTLFYGSIERQPALVLVFLCAAGIGTGTWSLYGPLFTELFTTDVRGSAMSIIMNSTRGVQFVAPVAIAAVAPRWGMGGGISLAAAFALLGAAWIWTLPETRGRMIED
jgi:MFS family permease